MPPLRTSALLAALLLCSSSANSQDTPRSGAGGGRPEGRGRAGQPGFGEGGPRFGMLPVMRALDADQDGTLSAAEIQNASKALATLDKNGDGAISADEMRPDPAMLGRSGQPGAPGRPGTPGQTGRPGAGGAPSGEMLTRMFDMRDADKDGKLTGDEIPERMRENVSRMDANGDGAIDRDELQKAMSRMAEQSGRQRGGRGTEGGEGVKPKRPTEE